MPENDNQIEYKYLRVIYMYFATSFNSSSI
jgi:hypothetical protein